MKLLKLTFTIITVLTIAGCDKNNNEVTPDFTGTYNGRFYYRNTNLAANYTLPGGTLTVVFDGNKYTSTSPNPQFAASANGSFVVDNHQITFSDSSPHTANFDWGMVLNGRYNISTQGDSVLLVRTEGTASYNYKLKKQ